MSHWVKKPLNAICVVDWGNTSLTKKAYEPSGQYLAVSAAGCDGRIGHAEHKAFTPVLSAIGAQCGKIFWPVEDFTAIKNTITLTPKVGESDSRFLFHLLEHIELPKRGAAQPFMSKGDISAFSVPVPPLPVQKRIAAILDAADSLRTKRRESIEQLDSLVQATFLEMFGDPVTNPKGWEARELAELVDIDAAMIDPTQRQYRALLHYGPDRITKDTGELLPAQTAAEDGLTSGKFLCKPGHVLYSKIRPYLNKVAIVTQECLCSADVYPVSPRHSMIVKEFLWAVLRSKSFLGYIESCAGRANIPKINRKEFMAYRCQCPPLSLQTRFASIVESIERQKARLKAHLAELDTLFASLQSHAFNGELVA